MYRTINQLALVALLSLVSSVSIAANKEEGPTDSTKLASLDVNSAAQPVLLAQGTVNSNPIANNAPIFPVQVNQRCGQGTVAYLRTSLVGTYENAFYATGGIVNTLALTPDYKIQGIIYMSNRGAVGANNYSTVTMNWQVWCTAKTTT